MRDRSTTVALALLAGAGAAVVVTIWLVAASLARSLDAPFGAFEALFGVTYLSFLLVGVLIVAHRRSSLVGVSLALAGLLGIVNLPLAAYAHYALATGELDLGPLAAVLRATVQGISLILILSGVVVFPTGSGPSPRWRPFIFAFLGAGTLFIAGSVFQPTVFFSDRFPEVANPLAVGPMGDIVLGSEPFIPALFLILLIVPFAAVIARYRDARGIERQQLKWLAYSGTVLAVILVVIVTTRAWVFALLLPFLLAMIPVSIGVAVLRYRLYDIDLVINRTLVYGAASAVLVGTYAGTVVLFQALLRPFTAGSDIAVAASTLLVVALFQPIRRNVQEFVDRRFYRSRYDSARTLDAFSARLRNDVELESVRDDLLGVIGETVRPVHVSVWLRDRSA